MSNYKLNCVILVIMSMKFMVLFNKYLYVKNFQYNIILRKAEYTYTYKFKIYCY